MTAIEFSISADKPVTAPSRRIQSIVVITTILALAAVSRFGLIAWPFWNDSGLYIALGRSVAHGQVMYRDFYETKLPGTGMLMFAAWRAFGPCWPAYVVAQFAMTLLAAGAIARAVGRHFGGAAAVPCFLYAAAYLNFDYAVFTGFQLETIQALFECLAAASALEALLGGDDRSAFATGLAAAVAAMAKPGGTGVAVASFLCLIPMRRWKGVTAVCVGFAIPSAATILFTVGTGAWPYLPGVVREIREYASGSPMSLGDLIRTLVLLIGLFLPFALCPKHTPDGPTPPLRFVFLWFSFDLAAAIAQHRMYLYYFLPLAGPAAVLYGFAARKISPVRILIGVLPVALLSLTWEACDPVHWSRGLQLSPLSTYIAAHTAPGDHVFIDPPGRVTIETDRDPGASAGVLFYWVNDDDAPRRFCDRLITDLDSRKTKYIVLSAAWDVPVPPMADGAILVQNPSRRFVFIQNWARFRTYLNSDYEVETTIEGEKIYRRKPSSF